MTATFASIVGARPQFIKAAAITTALRRDRFRHLNSLLIHTGQHYDYEMSQIFFDRLDLPEPDHHLGVGSGSHGQQTARMLEALERALEIEKPDVVLIYGDTNTTLAGALAASKLRIPIAHVEAGLRSGRMDMPEEINRVVADRLSNLRFCPTKTAIHNLEGEGILEGITLTGDVMREVLEARLSDETSDPDPLERFDLIPRAYALATIHRAENTDDSERLESIMAGLERIVASGVPLILPLHPRTRGALGGRAIKRVRVVDPLGYREMLALEQQAQVILTDSGGVQKEAYWLGVPCVTFRSETEWPETLEGGWNVLVDCDSEQIAGAAGRPVPADPPQKGFGEGSAAEKILDTLVGFSESRATPQGRS